MKKDIKKMTILITAMAALGVSHSLSLESNVNAMENHGNVSENANKIMFRLLTFLLEFNQ